MSGSWVRTIGLYACGCMATQMGYSQAQRATILHVVITQHGIEVQPKTIKAGTVVLFVDNQTPLRSTEISIGPPGQAVITQIEAKAPLPAGRFTKRVNAERVLRPGQYAVWLDALPKVSTRLTVTP